VGIFVGIYGLQTASINLKQARFSPYQPDVVIEQRYVADNSLGEHAWDPRDYDPAEPEEEQDQEAPAAGTECSSVGMPKK